MTAMFNKKEFGAQGPNVVKVSSRKPFGKPSGKPFVSNRGFCRSSKMFLFSLRKTKTHLCQATKKSNMSKLLASFPNSSNSVSVGNLTLTSKKESILSDLLNYAGLGAKQITKKDVSLGSGKLVYEGCEFLGNTVFWGKNTENYMLVFQGMEGLKLFQKVVCHESFDFQEKDLKITQCGFKLKVNLLKDRSLAYYSQGAWELLQNRSDASKIAVSFENHIIQVGKRGSRLYLGIIPEIYKSSNEASVDRIGLDVRLNGNVAIRLARFLSTPENPVFESCVCVLFDHLRVFYESSYLVEEIREQLNSLFEDASLVYPVVVQNAETTSKNIVPVKSACKTLASL